MTVLCKSWTFLCLSHSVPLKFAATKELHLFYLCVLTCEAGCLLEGRFRFKMFSSGHAVKHGLLLLVTRCVFKVYYLHTVLRVLHFRCTVGRIAVRDRCYGCSKVWKKLHISAATHSTGRQPPQVMEKR